MHRHPGLDPGSSNYLDFYFHVSDTPNRIELLG